jgi:HEAT repeats
MSLMNHCLKNWDLSLKISAIGAGTIACFLLSFPAFSQPIIDRPSRPRFEDVPNPVPRACSETEIQAYLGQLDFPSLLVIYRSEYISLVTKCRKSAVSALTEALKSQNEHIRSNAALALGDIGGDAITAMPALIEVLDDRYSTVRQNSAYALGQMEWQAEAAIPDLSKRLEDENRAVIASAAYAIGQIGSSIQARYEEMYTVVTERNGIRYTNLSEAGETRLQTLKIELYEALFPGFNQLYIDRIENAEAWQRDVHAENAFLSIVEAIDAVNMTNYLYDELSMCKGGVKSDVSCVEGGAQLVANIQSQINSSRPAICRVVPFRYILPRCRTR